MPKTDWNIDIFQLEAPRLCVNLRVRHHSVGRATPGAARTSETCFKCGRVAQGLRITWLEPQEAAHPLIRHSNSRKRTRHMKEHSQQLRVRSVQCQHPAIKFQQTAM